MARTFITKKETELGKKMCVCVSVSRKPQVLLFVQGAGSVNGRSD